MDYEEMFDVLIGKVGKEEIGRIVVEKHGKEELSRIIVEKHCPHSYHLSESKHCGTNLQYCSNCWAKALGMEEE
jgi:hypothetical protein